MVEDRDEALERARAGAVLAEAESRAHVVPPASLEVEDEPNAVEPSAEADTALGDPLPESATTETADDGGEHPGELEPASAEVEPTAAADVALGDPLSESPADGNGRDGTDHDAEAALALVEAEEQVSQPDAVAKEDKTLAIHHIGVAVGSIDEAMRFYGNTLGLDVADRIDMPERSLRVAFVRTGNTLIELLEPMNSESTVARFIERRGPGLHHLCFGTPDIAEHLRDLKDKGVDLIDETARPGAHGDVAFLSPAAAYGVLIELLQELPPDKLAAREDPRPY